MKNLVIELNTKLSTYLYKDKKKTLAIFITIMLLEFILLITSIEIFSKYDKVYNCIHIQNIDLGGYTKDKLVQKLSSIVQNNKDNSISIETKNKSTSFNLRAIGLNYNQQKTIDNIYNIGHTGNIFIRIAKIINLQLNPDEVYIKYSYNNTLLDNIIDNFYEITYSPKKEYSLTTNTNLDFVTINSGSPEVSINKDELKKKIIDIILYHKTKKILIKENINKQNGIDLENAYSAITQEAENATIKVLNKKSYKLVKSKPNIGIDKNLLETAIKQINQKDSIDITIPITVKEATINEKQLKSKLFKNTLSSFTTSFNSGNISRSTNIRLAASKINSVIVMPKEKFSFNGFLGARTISKGYQVAPVYINGKISTGVGGGICQVSTTIHNAVLRQADMELISRQYHYFTVDYVPLGYDATVSYPEPDYVFKNNANYPIRLKMSVNGNTLTALIVGTKENNKTVSLRTSGSGLNINTYRTIKIGKKIISNKLLYYSSYEKH